MNCHCLSCVIVVVHQSKDQLLERKQRHAVYKTATSPFWYPYKYIMEHVSVSPLPTPHCTVKEGSKFAVEFFMNAYSGFSIKLDSCTGKKLNLVAFFNLYNII